MRNRKNVWAEKVACRVGGGRVISEILFDELICELKPESREGGKKSQAEKRVSAKGLGQNKLKSERPDKCDHSTMCPGRWQKPDITLQVKGF